MSRLRRANILVVDPEEVTRRHLGDFLTTMGYGVDTASNQEEALALLAQKPYTAAVVDDAVSGPGNQALLARFQEQNPEVAVIVMSTTPTIQAIVASLRQGAVDYIIKPYEIQDLAFIVPRVVERGRAVQT